MLDVQQLHAFTIGFTCREKFSVLQFLIVYSFLIELSEREARHLHLARISSVFPHYA